MSWLAPSLCATPTLFPPSCGFGKPFISSHFISVGLPPQVVRAAPPAWRRGLWCCTTSLKAVSEILFGGLTFSLSVARPGSPAPFPPFFYTCAGWRALPASFILQAHFVLDLSWAPVVHSPALPFHAMQSIGIRRLLSTTTLPCDARQGAAHRACACIVSSSSSFGVPIRCWNGFGFFLGFFPPGATSLMRCPGLQ